MLQGTNVLPWNWQKKLKVAVRNWWLSIYLWYVERKPCQEDAK